MGSAVVIFVFPAPQFRRELRWRVEGRPPIEFFLIRAMTAFHFAIHFGTTRRDPVVGDPEIAEMPGEIRAEFVTVVGLDPLDGHREPLAHLVKECDRVRDRVVGIDSEDPVTGGLIDRGELIETPTAELQMLDIHLDGQAGHCELAAAPRSGPVPLHRDPRYPVPLEDLVDRRDGDIHLMEPLEVEANPDRPVLPFGPDPQDEGYDVWWGGKMGLARARFEVLEPLEPLFAVSTQPRIELAARHSKEPTRLADVVGYLLIVLDSAKSGLCLS